MSLEKLVQTQEPKRNKNLNEFIDHDEPITESTISPASVLDLMDQLSERILSTPIFDTEKNSISEPYGRDFSLDDISSLSRKTWQPL